LKSVHLGDDLIRTFSREASRASIFLRNSILDGKVAPLAGIARQPGDVSMMLADFTTAMPLVKAGALRPLVSRIKRTTPDRRPREQLMRWAGEKDNLRAG
jgi:hypothetical protein